MKLPAELKPEDVTAIVDTREQLPLDLSPLRVESGTLATGDYSVRGLENVIALERKTLNDFLACCGTERERFEREIQRLLSYPTRAVVIEASWADLERGEWRSKLTPSAAIGSALGWVSAGIPILMAGSRDRAQILAARILFIAARRSWRQLRALAAGIETGAA